MDVYEIVHNGLRFRLERDDNGDVFASLPDLPGCFSEGQTLDEALDSIQKALPLFVQGSLEAGLPIPERYRSLHAAAS